MTVRVGESRGSGSMTIGDEAAVTLLEEMLRAPSLCGEEDEVAGVLLAAMRNAGFEVRRDEVGNVIGSIGPREGREVVILGHMDTVPGNIPVRRCDGVLRGRGAVDAKGPLATGIVAASRAADRAHARLTVIGAVQEEGPSVGARHLTLRPAPTYLIIAEPSGWDSIVLGYKGSQRFTVSLGQRSAHTAGPEVTSSERLVAFWNELVAWCAEQSPEGVNPETGRKDRFIDLTPTLISMGSKHTGLKDIAFMHVGLRLPPGVSVEALAHHVRALSPEGSVDFAPGEPAVRGEKKGPLVAGFLRAIRGAGGNPRFKVKTGTSDMNVVGPVWGCPMLAYGPGDSKLDHTPEEHVVIDEYLCAIRVLTAVLEEI